VAKRCPIHSAATTHLPAPPRTRIAINYTSSLFTMIAAELLETVLRLLLRYYLSKHPLLSQTLARISNTPTPTSRSPARSPPLQMRAMVSQILPNKLYLSGVAAALSADTLRSYRITHVLSIMSPTETIQLPEQVRGSIIQRRIPLSDTTTANLLHHLPDIVEFISSALERDDARVLVHCIEGVSRSASAVIGYLIAERGMSFRQALRVVKMRRQAVCPNLGFVRQLSEWATKCEANKDEREWEKVLKSSSRKRRSADGPSVKTRDSVIEEVNPDCRETKKRRTLVGWVGRVFTGSAKRRMA
jgi:protein-tyrosine phosphatase